MKPKLEAKFNMAYGEGETPILVYLPNMPLETWTCLTQEEAQEFYEKLKRFVEFI